MTWPVRALHAAIVALWALPTYLGAALLEDTLLGDQSFWMELCYGSKRRLLSALLRTLAEGAPTLLALGAAVSVAGRLLERRPLLLRLLTTLLLGGALGVLLGRSAASVLPSMLLTALVLWGVDLLVRARLAESAP